MESYIAFGSLIVAALAVFVGPVVSWYVAKYQSDLSQRVAVKQIIAPMRQKWIDDLRNRVAELISEAHWFFRAGDDDAKVEAERKLLFLTRQIQLMLNPNESDHQNLFRVLGDVVKSGLDGNDVLLLQDLVGQATAACQAILKREWNRVKTDDL